VVIFWSSCIVAGLTAFWLEFPLLVWLKDFVTGAPTKRDWSDWKRDKLYDDTEPEPTPVHPRLAVWLSCGACASFWLAFLVAFTSCLWDDSGVSPWFLWPAAWLLGRLLFGAVRWLEFQGPD